MNANTVYYRTNGPRLNILRGYWGNENFGLTAAVPVDASVASGPFSGQVMFINTSGNWVLASSASTPKGQCPYLSMEDVADSDVVSVGKLTGLSCAGNYEVQTPYFDLTQTYPRNAALTYDATSGLVVPAGNTSGDYFIQNPSVDIVGYVTAGVVDLNIGGPGNMNGTLSGLVANAGIDSQALPINLVSGSASYAGQTVTTGNAYIGKIPVLQFATRWLPARDVTNTVS
jgi:hypothetical protein